jgi:serine/threonine-protein kinase
MYDETIEKDIVLGYADGTPPVVKKGDAVGLRVSAGPEPRTIPGGLSGGTKDAVTAQLKGMGLQVAYAEEYSETTPIGLVVTTNPGPGAQLAKGDTVTVRISLGDKPITIPVGLAGMSVADATKVLEGLGLKVGGVQGNPGQKVTAINPAIGTEVKPGSTVTIITK